MWYGRCIKRQYFFRQDGLKVAQNVHNRWFSCDVIKIPKGKLRPPQRCSFRDGPLEKFFGGEGGDFRATQIFFLNISLAGLFFSVCKKLFFLGYSLCINFFSSLNFPLHEFFFGTSPAPPS